MTRSLTITVIWVCLLTQSWAGYHKLVIFKESYAQGANITFTEKHPDLSEWKSFLSEIGSWCLQGFWGIYDLQNYEYNGTLFRGMGVTEFCRNYTSFLEFEFANSIRYLGPEEIDTPAIALYEGSGDGDWEGDLSGREILVTGPAKDNLEFSPVQAYSFGGSSWTLFTGKNFDGESECFAGANWNNVYTGTWTPRENFTVGSVVMGCDTVEVANNINLYLNEGKD